MIGDATEPTLYAKGMIWGEGPRRHDGALWLSDTQGSKLWTDASGQWTAHELASPSNGLWFLPDGRLVGAMMAQKHVGLWNGTDWDTYADLAPLEPGPLGDMIGDAAGNLYIDDVAYAAHRGEAPRPGRILWVGIDGSCKVAAADIAFPNGMALIDGGKTLIVAETMAQKLSAFTVEAPGVLTDKRDYFDVAGQIGSAARPDGICGTADGVWICTLDGRSLVLVRDAHVARRIDTGDRRPIACWAEGTRLFVTMARTGGLSVFEAVNAKAVSAEVVVYDLEN